MDESDRPSMVLILGAGSGSEDELAMSQEQICIENSL